MEIVKEKENPFLKRKEITFLMKHPNATTPSKMEVIKAIAGSNSIDESQVVIDYIFTKKGIPESMIKVKLLKEKPKVIAKPEAKQGENSEAQANKAT